MSTLVLNLTWNVCSWKTIILKKTIPTILVFKDPSPFDVPGNGLPPRTAFLHMTWTRLLVNSFSWLPQDSQMTPLFTCVEPKHRPFSFLLNLLYRANLSPPASCSLSLEWLPKTRSVPLKLDRHKNEHFLFSWLRLHPVARNFQLWITLYSSQWESKAKPVGWDILIFGSGMHPLLQLTK